jgi:hypothetical protein
LLLGLSVVHHVFSLVVLQTVYRMSVPRSRYVAWFPVANLVVEWILIRAIRMCLTGKVTWRGTDYGQAASAAPKVSKTVSQ